MLPAILIVFYFIMDKSTKTELWKALESHAKSFPSLNARKASQFNVFSSNIHLDYSNQQMTDQTIELLLSLAEASHLKDKMNALILGEHVNLSEKKPALHTALRAPDSQSILVNQQNVMTEVIATRNRIQVIVEKIRNQGWLGYSQKPITDVVNIGIGGSDLGPRFSLKTLWDYRAKHLQYHFISDADPMSFSRVVETLNPETTLFIVSSKSFTTKETLYNARKAMQWIGAADRHMSHFIAVTAHRAKAERFGIHTILPIWDWVGGRYSFCSAINLITAIAIGYEKFSELLKGANSMDQHFQQSEFGKNLPVLLALIGIWNNNFLNIHNLLILTEANHLEKFVPYIQQLDMESNGKSMDNHGHRVNYRTGPLIWGGNGNQAQHSYYQLLCQGTHKISLDLISVDAFDGELINDLCYAKIKILTQGVTQVAHPSAHISGNIPLNHIRLHDNSPFTVGALIALYEHKIFTQSVIWDINPFDQPGVESAKRGPTMEKEKKIVETMA